MKTKRLLPISCIILFAGSILSQGCGTSRKDTVTSPSTSCQGGSAQIAIGDAYLQRLCGCQESAGQFFQPTQPLSCTVSAGSTVAFQYVGTLLRHQILPVGNPAFAPSPPNDPRIGPLVRVHYITLTSPGIYKFQDIMDTALAGNIIVQ